MKKFFFINIFIIIILSSNFGFSKTEDYLDKGIKLFNNKDFDKSKIFFEKDLVFNPKSERSYLYLAKIFKYDDNDEEQEINLNNVLLLNPKNDEAIYLLILLKIEQSDYNKTKELLGTFALVCDSFCSKKKKIEDKLKKMSPENAQNNN